MLQVAEEEELQVEAGSFCSAFLQEFIMAPYVHCALAFRFHSA